jgi:cholesterol oxidase
MKTDPRGLPRLSERLGHGIRTNSEALIGVVSTRPRTDVSRGLAIGSILRIDDDSSLEPCRYPAGSGFFRLLTVPHVDGEHLSARLSGLLLLLLRSPLRVLRALFVRDWAKATSILLYMRRPEGTLRFVKSWLPGGMRSAAGDGSPPRASLPEATALAQAFSRELDGVPFSLVTETLFDIPTTAHVLGGCCMGRDAETGVIDSNHRVFGYEGLWIVDGSTISENPGVNPSLTIVALAERAMALVPAKTPEEAAP